MKILSRDFTLKERILLVGLAVILLGLAYYYFVDTPVRQAIVSSETESDALQIELDNLQQHIMYLQGVRKNLDEIEQQNGLSWMGSYNNSNVEVRFLNDVLADTVKYTINFANVTRNGDQIRRNFTLQFQTVDFDAAQKTLTELLHGENRCLVGDMKCTVEGNGYVNINATATFYETMVGGVVDAVLPKDGGSVKN